METMKPLWEQAMELIEAGEDNCGICTHCRYEQSCVEPDAYGYECESCGERAVKGCEQIIIEADAP